MSPSDSEGHALQAAVRAIWQECGHAPPEGADLLRAGNNLRLALAAGRHIPRTTDKTLQPMTGRRFDIETQACDESMSSSSFAQPEQRVLQPDEHA